MKRGLSLSVCMLFTLGSLTSFGAEEKSTIAPESADDITLALARLAVETKADAICD